MSHKDIDFTIKAVGRGIPLAPGPCPECDYPDALYNTAVDIVRHVAEGGTVRCPATPDWEQVLDR